MQSVDVAIVGGGMVGLAVACGLQGSGLRVAVLEQRVQEPLAANAPPQLRVSAINAASEKLLTRLGVWQDILSRRASCYHGMEVWDKDSFGHISFDDQSMGYSHLGHIVENSVIHYALWNKAHQSSDITLLAPAELQQVAWGENETFLTLKDGSMLTARLVIGADGLHSVLRRALNGNASAFFTKQVAWRAIVPNTSAHPAEAQVHMGPGRHIVSYPLRDGSSVNLVAVEERSHWVDEGWAQEDAPENLRAAFAGFGGRVPEMLASVERVGLWGLFRHPVARSWHGEGVALLGDAAHPTLPFMAQGANMALEDAWTLAACLAADADQARALERYQSRRRNRCERIVSAANGNAWKYHLRNPLVRGVAHRGLGLAGRLMPQRMLRQFDWIYGHDVTAAA